MIQVDIKMPEYCYECPLHNGERGVCNITDDSTCGGKRPFDCPLIEMKVDRRLLNDYEVRSVVCDYGVYAHGELKLILNSHTIAQMIADLLIIDESWHRALNSQNFEEEG